VEKQRGRLTAHIGLVKSLVRSLEEKRTSTGRTSRELLPTPRFSLGRLSVAGVPLAKSYLETKKRKEGRKGGRKGGKGAVELKDLCLTRCCDVFHTFLGSGDSPVRKSMANSFFSFFLRVAASAGFGCVSRKFQKGITKMLQR